MVAGLWNVRGINKVKMKRANPAVLLYTDNCKNMDVAEKFLRILPSKMSKCLAKFEVIFWNSIFRLRGEAASLISMEWPWLVPRRCRNAIWENFSQLYRVHDMLLWVFVG